MWGQTPGCTSPAKRRPDELRPGGPPRRKFAAKFKLPGVWRVLLFGVTLDQCNSFPANVCESAVLLRSVTPATRSPQCSTRRVWLRSVPEWAQLPPTSLRW